MIKFQKKKNTTRLRKTNFINNVKHIYSFQTVENLRVKQISPEVFLLYSL